MSRIETLFKELRREGRQALIPFITAGDPTLDTTKALVKKIAESGADIIELGVPFSDPLADGPVIQRSALRSLSAGTTLKKILNMVGEIRKEINTPIVLMSSYNPVFVYGLERFCADASQAGVDGFIIPDLPPEEAVDLKAEADKRDIDTIFLLAPTTGEGRIKFISGQGRGFLYYVSLTGVTGSRTLAAKEVEERLAAIRKITGKPICVGFGISTPEQAKEIACFSDGVIVGAAIVRMVEELGEGDALLEKVGDFVRSLKDAI